jgi:hypothetical protein
MHEPLDGPAGDLHQTEAPARIGKVSSLTDLRAVEAFRRRLESETGMTVRASSMWKLVVEEKRSGSYARTAQIGSVKFNAEGVATAFPADLAPNEDEAKAISKEWSLCSWPSHQPVLFTAPYLPRNDPQMPWSFADPANLAVCKSADGQMILCVEERRYRDDGSKDAFIWTYWSHGDAGQWLCMEPPDALPLFGLDTIRDASTIYVHEGPKAAKAAQALIADDERCAAHPWGAELRGWKLGAVAHVGWLGGAERPQATDWRPLASSGAQIIIICDNDNPGRNAVRHISRRIRREMWMVQFDDRFPERFDMANAVEGLPDVLFEEPRDEA